MVHDVHTFAIAKTPAFSRCKREVGRVRYDGRADANMISPSNTHAGGREHPVSKYVHVHNPIFALGTQRILILPLL